MGLDEGSEETHKDKHIVGVYPCYAGITQWMCVHRKQGREKK